MGGLRRVPSAPEVLLCSTPRAWRDLQRHKISEDLNPLQGYRSPHLRQCGERGQDNHTVASMLYASLSSRSVLGGMEPRLARRLACQRPEYRKQEISLCHRGGLWLVLASAQGTLHER